jgi:hypothetical protein
MGGKFEERNFFEIGRFFWNALFISRWQLRSLIPIRDEGVSLAS